MQLKPIFIKKEVPTLVFSWQLSEILNNNFFKEWEKALLWERSIVIRNEDQISIANVITQLFV